MSHTPAPWFVSSAYGDGSALWISPEIGPKMILQGANCLRSDSVKYEQISIDQLQANATLIAAAPELLEACKVAFDQTCSVGRPKDWEQLRAAIAKATGSAA